MSWAMTEIPGWEHVGEGEVVESHVGHRLVQAERAQRPGWRRW